MSDRPTSQTGTSPIGGTEARSARGLASLLIPIAAVGAALALVPLWLGDSRVLMGVAVLGLAFACYTIGFNVIFGSTGQLFLCTGALAGIGGYGAAILADTVGLPILVSILVATLVATVIGGLLSFVAVRRSLGVIFTGIVTLIFSMFWAVSSSQSRRNSALGTSFLVMLWISSTLTSVGRPWQSQPWGNITL